MAAMQPTKEAVKERLKALFDVDYEPDDAQKQREEAARKIAGADRSEADALTKEDGDLVDAAKAAALTRWITRQRRLSVKA